MIHYFFVLLVVVVRDHTSLVTQTMYVEYFLCCVFGMVAECNFYFKFLYFIIYIRRSQNSSSFYYKLLFNLLCLYHQILWTPILTHYRFLERTKTIQYFVTLKTMHPKMYILRVIGIVTIFKFMNHTLIPYIYICRCGPPRFPISICHQLSRARTFHCS